jgi:hypothetical protein
MESMSSPTPQPPTYQALYRACMKEAASQGRSLMQRLAVRAGEAMQRRGTLAPDESERRLLTEAARTLMKHDAALCEAYPQALLAEFAHAIAGDTRKAAAMSFDSLELMGDEQVRENVELMRMQQAVDSQVEAELTDLNTLVCAVQGLKSVQADRNPLRPEVYVRSLRTVTLQSPIPAPMRARWMLHLGEALGPELARVYAELAGWLRSHGVAEARFTAVPSAEPPQQVPPSSLLNLHELRKLVAGDFDEGSAPPPTDFSKTLPAAVDALESMKQAQVDLVVQRARARQAAGAGHPAQALAQEVVGMMLDNIAGDTRLLAPVRQCVRELEPALRRLAHDDPRFFSDRKHPARRLLDELTQRSLAWESEQSSGFVAFIEPLRQAVEVLQATRVPGAEPFDFALKTLEDAWGDLQRRDRHHREKAVRALLNAEQRNLLADKVGRGLGQRPDLAGAPREVAAFITGPWSQVIAQARLTDTTGSHDPGGYTSILTDFIWSSQPDVAGTHPGRLLKLVPGLVEKLRHGLATIDYPASKTERFLDYLSRVHRRALRAGAAATAAAEGQASLPPQLTREELEEMMGESGNGPDAWLAPHEAQDSGFMDTNPSLSPRAAFTSTQGGAFTTTQPPKEEEEVPELPLDLLQPGAWVEMMTGDGWQRFQVNWASPHGMLFMFTGASGHPQSMTRRLVAKLLQAGTLKLISGRAVVDGALDAVAEKALRNTVPSKL